jgi:hypothetical protein
MPSPLHFSLPSRRGSRIDRLRNSGPTLAKHAARDEGQQNETYGFQDIGGHGKRGIA